LQTITVMVNPAPRYDLSRTFTVNLSDPSGANLNNTKATGTIQNPNAPPRAAISGATVTASPGGPTVATFTVTLTAAAGLPVTVDYRTTDATAKAGFDYVAAPLTLLRFDPGQTMQTVTVMVNAAAGDAVKKVFNVALSDPSNAIIQASQATITIIHATSGTSIFSEDAARVFQTAPRITILAAGLTASPSAPTAATITVNVSSVSAQTVVVDYTTSDGTATAGGDYLAVPDAPLSIAPGQDHQSAVVTINPKPRYDTPRSFTVVLSASTNAIILGSRATVTINNPNPPPTVSITDAVVTAPPDGPATASFTVSLSAASDLPVTIDYATANGTATGGSDYVAVPTTTLTFAPGQTAGMITVPVNSAPAGASPRTFLVTLSNPSDATIAGGPATGTIKAVGSPAPTPTPSPTPTPTPVPSPTPTPTPTPTPSSTSAPVPTLTAATAISSGKGKKKKITGGQLTFSAPLDAGSAQATSNYHVTQAINKKKTAVVPVLTAVYSASNHSVTLTLGKLKPGKPLQVMVSGLRGAGGALVGSLFTNL
jgi:hypothetical protein